MVHIVFLLIIPTHSFKYIYRKEEKKKDKKETTEIGKRGYKQPLTSTNRITHLIREKKM